MSKPLPPSVGADASSPSSRRRADALGDSVLFEFFQRASDAVACIDARGRIVFANDAARRLFDERFAPDCPVERVMATRFRRMHDGVWKKLKAGGDAFDAPVRLASDGNDAAENDASFFAMRDTAGDLTGYSVLLRVAPTAKENEARIARRTAQLYTLNAIAETVTELPGLAVFLERVLNAVLRVTGLTGGCIHLTDDEDESLTLAAHHGLSEGFCTAFARFEAGEGTVGRSATLGEAIFFARADDDPYPPPGDWRADGGALASVPLIACNGVRGVLTLHHTHAHVFTAHERSMLSAIGRQVGVALEHMRLFEEVTTARREWERTFEAMTDGVSIHSTSGKIRRANKSLGALFGVAPASLVGVRCCELYHSSKRPRPNCTILKTVNERRAQHVELTNCVQGRTLRVTTDPILNECGRVVGVVCTTRDITGEKMLENRLIQQERISAIGELSAGIAHEVGTPLNIISANVEYLLKHKEFSTGREELEAIREQTHTITTLIHQLLDFARERTPKFSPVNINLLIDRTVGLLAHALNRGGIQVRQTLAPYIPTVDGDASLLQQVLFNVIKNACQAMESVPSEAKRPRLLAVATDSILSQTEEFAAPHVVISIADTGPGVSATDLPHVMKPFYTSHKDGGTGLGLAICQHIIQRHQGRLTIENGAPTGALVRIHLPLAQQ
jgi:two-component system, NtrC family, sensor kinase